MAADLLLQFTTDAALLGPLHLDALLASVPVWRIWAGGLLGAFAFVLAGSGIWYASLGLAGTPRLACAFLVSGLLAYAWGAAFHVTFLFRGLVDHAGVFGTTIQNAGPLLDAFRQGQFALVAASAVALLIASVCFGLPVAAGRTAYPRPAAALSPVVVYVVLTVAAYTIPVASFVLAPTTFSVMSLVFFTSNVTLLGMRRPSS